MQRCWLRSVLWAAFSFACFFLSFSAALWLLAYQHYGFSFWYDALNISQHLNTYAVQNTLKPGFHLLDKADHVAAFEGIATAVAQQGQGLAELSYVHHGQRIALLTADEILHLMDVAHLFSRTKVASLFLLMAWPALAWLALRHPLPPLRLRLISLLVPVMPIVLWLLAAGPEAVFYQLHIWWFPAEHPWFFYWQESHMSALMKAPILFAALAVVLLVLAVLIAPMLYALGYWCFGKGR